MAEIRYWHLEIDKEGQKRPDEPLIRPYVVLNDGTVMTFKEWNNKGMPS